MNNMKKTWIIVAGIGFIFFVIVVKLLDHDSTTKPISSSIKAAKSDSDYYSLGVEDFGMKKYRTAIDHFGKLNSGDEHFSEKESWIDSAKNAATKFYADLQKKLDVAERKKDYASISNVMLALLFSDFTEHKAPYERLKAQYGEKIEKMERASEMVEFRKQVTNTSYAKLLRNPDEFENKKIKVKGQVIQKIEGGYLVQTKLYGQDIILVRWSEQGFIEKDIVEILGEFTGLKSYTTALGVGNTVPFIDAKFITMIKKREDLDD